MLTRSFEDCEIKLDQYVGRIYEYLDNAWFAKDANYLNPSGTENENMNEQPILGSTTFLPGYLGTAGHRALLGWSFEVGLESSAARERGEREVEYGYYTFQEEIQLRSAGYHWDAKDTFDKSESGEVGNLDQTSDELMIIR
jgi:hypothetical protein